MESPTTVRILVVADETDVTPPLIEAVRARAAHGSCQFTLVVPSAADGMYRFVDPEDQETDDARSALARALPLLEQAAGAPVVEAEAVVRRDGPPVDLQEPQAQPAPLERAARDVPVERLAREPERRRGAIAPVRAMQLDERRQVLVEARGLVGEPEADAVLGVQPKS